MIDTAGTLRGRRADASTTRARSASTRRDAPGLLRQRVREPRGDARSSEIVVTDTIPLRPGAPDNIRVLSVRGPADRLDPPHLHRRLGHRGLRRREPAVLSTASACRTLLGLTEEELLQVLDVRPARRLTGELDHRPRAADPARCSPAEERGATGGAGSRAAPGAADCCSQRDFARLRGRAREWRERGFVLRGGQTDQTADIRRPRPAADHADLISVVCGSGRFSPGHDAGEVAQPFAPSRSTTTPRDLEDHALDRGGGEHLRPRRLLRGAPSAAPRRRSSLQTRSKSLLASRPATRPSTMPNGL